MITIEDLERIAQEHLKIPPDLWMESVGLTKDAYQWLRETAEASNMLGRRADSIRMVGFQLGYEAAKKDLNEVIRSLGEDVARLEQQVTIDVEGKNDD